MPEYPFDELSLIRQARQGDHASFETLVIHYRPHAVCFAKSLIQDGFYAEDIAQECFAKVYLRLAGFDPRHSFKSWLFAIIRNQCIDYLRKSKPEAALTDTWQAPAEGQPAQFLERQEAWDDFLAQYKTLPADARTAIYLFVVEGMPHGEIARVMGKNIPQIKMLVYRARKSLKKKGDGGDDG